MLFDLHGRVALVTGAGQSVGAGIAATLAEAGAVVVTNDVVGARAQATAERIVDDGGQAVAAAFDVTDYDAVVAGFEAAAAAVGPVDVLVNNAGIASGAGAVFFRESNPEYWQRWIDINLYGVMNCSRAVINGMCERDYGRVITISSGAGATGLTIGMSAYAAGKGGAISFMRHLAMETAGCGVTANTLALGLMDNVSADLVSKSGRVNPVGRLGTGRDVGAAAVWLAAEGSWVTGQTIHINGGALTS
jgi:NAD(P)-dependent dehydrogenase (short-subunit alcohol dehydrogenase family)